MMHPEPIVAAEVARARAQRDWLMAIVVTALFGAFWASQNGADLTTLRLPDTDDGMRLQQVRDWLAGQAWGDLHQYRLGPPGGLAMHWSRLVDVPLAAMIVALRPLLGQASAEWVAVIAWPLMLLTAQLVLIAAVTRRLAGDRAAVPAMIVAALAYPAMTLFQPGRIDHHNLQLVLLTACLHGMLAPPKLWRGAAIGAAIFASLAVGFELLPFLALVAAWAVLLWLRDAAGAAVRLAGVGLGLLGAAVLGPGLVPATRAEALCDALSLRLDGVLAAAGVAALLLAWTGDRVRISRWALAATAGAVLGGLAIALVPACLSGPYGAIDPLLKRVWLANVVEAAALASVPLHFGIAAAGLLVVGTVATLAQLRSERPGWWGMAALVLAALAITCVQVRGAYAGAMLVVPGLAAMIAAARGRRPLWLVGAWMASIGLLYPVIGAQFVVEPKPAAPAEQPCTGPEQLAALRTLPPGRIAAPIDIGAFAIPATAHSALAAPYHRNNGGNAAMYRLFLGPEREARAIIARHGIDYVAWCDGAFDEIDLAKDAAPDALVHRLRSDRAPAWLQPRPRGPLRVWSIAPSRNGSVTLLRGTDRP